MKKINGSYLRKIYHKRALARWSRAARRAETVNLGLLRAQRVRAHELRSRLDQVIFNAENRLALPRIGADSFFKPKGADWAWRPDLWRGPLPNIGVAAATTRTQMGDQVSLHHDCQQSELTLRQLRNTHPEDLAPFGLRADVFRFDGSFMSLVLELPNSATHGLQRRHLIRMDTIIETERPIEIFARLNVKHGPNTEQIVRELPKGEKAATTEFDLAYSKLNEKRIERAWIDLIFEDPEMNQIVLRDITFSRSPRAEL